MIGLAGHHTTFGEIAILLAMAAIAGFVGLQLRQPLIVAFIGVGLLAGPSGLDLVHAEAQIEVLAELGIAVLLFLVGVKLDVGLVRSLGVVAVTTGLGQVFFTSSFGFLIGLALGYGAVESLYIAVALTFSSTIIIVKLLSDKREIDSLHGQVALGFLIVQDLVVVLAMVTLSAIGIGTAGAHSGEGGGWPIVRVLAGAAGLLVMVMLFVRYAATPLTERLARAPELLITFAIGAAALLAAAADAIGLGKEMGGLLAGVALASTPYRDVIATRLSGLRDFLLLFFFIELGSTLDLSLIWGDLTAAVIFSAFVLVGNPLIVLTIMGAMGYRKRTGFLAGLTVAQISEFSLIFIAMGVALGHVGGQALGLVTLVGLITIAVSTYMITWSHHLYAFFEPWLGVFERRNPLREASGPAPVAADCGMVLFGYGRFGSALAARLRRAGERVLVVDFNPDRVRHARADGFAALYGDGGDGEFLAELPWSGIGWAILAMPTHAPSLTHEDTRLAVIHGLRAAGYRGRLAVVIREEGDRGRLAQAGADLMLSPFEDAADHAAALIAAAPYGSGVRPPGRATERLTSE
ncbi:MAG: cation:proton antiporter [Rubrimonas sp.]